ncbi:MAG TPA: carbon-nitrogen hydrolase family protein [Bacillales bacterium]|nr:carbon-nitrogen hydrolase family protein [Bacillales bacterium]
MKLNIAAIQMDCEIKKKRANLEKAERLIDEAGKDADIIALPEFFTTGYLPELIGDDFYELAETVPGPTVDRLAEKAKQHSSAIIANIVEKDANQTAVLYDTTFVIDSMGVYRGKYRKVHLYPTEHTYFRSGTSFPVFELAGTTIGLATCYDHAFGEMFRIMALKGAEVIFIPSAVPKNFEYLLDLRTRARAQDNQIFAVAVNRSGNDGDVKWCGSSKIVDPRGEVVAEAGEEECLLTGSVDLSMIAEERRQEPILRNRRPEIYNVLVHDQIL